jgi:hypothetical protein
MSQKSPFPSIFEFFVNEVTKKPKNEGEAKSGVDNNPTKPTLEEMRSMSMMQINKKYGNNPDLFQNHLNSIVVLQKNSSFAQEMVNFLTKKAEDILNQTTLNQTNVLIKIASDLAK